MNEIPELNTRDRILAVSLDLFADNGFSATPVRKIARKAGVRESSVYNHFESKADILHTVLSTFGFGFVKSILENNYLNMEINDPHAFIRMIVDDIMNRWNEPEDSKFIRILFMELFREPAAREAYTRDLDASRDFLVKLFSKMREMGVIKPMDPWVLANEFLALIVFIHIEYFTLMLDGKDTNKIYQYMRYQHVDFFWEAIKI